MDAKTLFTRTLAEPNDIFLKSKGFDFLTHSLISKLTIFRVVR